MSVQEIRQKLKVYLDAADDKKLKAIYTMLESDIENAQEWWNNAAFTEELDKRYTAWEKGKEKGYTAAETRAYISNLKKRSRRA